MISILLVANMATSFTTDKYHIESCDAVPFQLIKTQEQRRPIHSRDREGYVDLKIIVNEKGSFSQVKVTGAKPKRLFDKEARRAVKRWVFNKSELFERCYNVTFQFKLEEKFQ